METIVILFFLNSVISTSISAYELNLQQKIIKKWKEGSLTLHELNYLKRSEWFRKKYYKPVEAIAAEKKDD
jgi:hypothetical protein